MILTVTPNPALDVTYTLDRLVPHGTNRARSVEQRAGGKGVNVARVLHQLGRAARVVTVAGGATGTVIRSDLTAAGLAHETVSLDQESRRTVTLVSEQDGRATLVNEPGPRLTGHEWAELVDAVTRSLPRCSAAVFAGSLPPGAPRDGYAQLVTVASEQGVPTVVDTSGAALRDALSAGPDIVKPNAEELGELTGTDDPAAGAAVLREHGAKNVVVSLGPEGLLALTGGQHRCVAPDEVVRGNPTGAGDAAVAALAVGLETGAAWPERLREAVALSSAAVAAPVAGDFDSEQYQRARLAVSGGDAQPLEDTHAPRSHR